MMMMIMMLMNNIVLNKISVYCTGTDSLTKMVNIFFSTCPNATKYFYIIHFSAFFKCTVTICYDSTNGLTIKQIYLLPLVYNIMLKRNY